MRLMFDAHEIKIWTDGGARGNPGPAGIGAVLYRVDPSAPEENELIGKVSEYIGAATNNQAEYRALLRAIEELNSYVASGERAKENIKVSIYTDSELMAYQITGRYKVKNAELLPLYTQVFALLQSYGSYTITPVRREKNQVADKLVNEAIDAALARTTHV